MKRWITIAGFLIVVALLVVSLFPRERQNQPVRIGYLPILASLPLFVAQENGYFNETVETFPLQSSNQLVDALLRGDIDIAVESSAAPVFMAELVDAGRMKIFSASDITADAPFDSLLVRKDSPIETLKSLKGRKIGVFPGTTATRLLKAFLAGKGLDTTTMEFIQIVPQNQLPALYAGSVDALHSYEPTTTIALEGGQARKLYGSVYAEQLNHNPQGVALLSAAFIEKSPLRAQNVVAAFDRAFNYLRENDTEARMIAAKTLGINQSAAERTVFLYMNPSGALNNDVLQAYADMLFSLGELKGRIEVSGILYKP